MSTAPNDSATRADAAGEQRPGGGQAAEERIAGEAEEQTASDAEGRIAGDAEEGIAGEVEARLRDAEERLSASAEQSIEKIKAYVKKNPMASAGIAFVAGLVVSSLIRR